MRNFFEGWYFKQQADEYAIALIPALHTDKIGTTASLQIVTEKETHCIMFPKEALRISRKEPRIELGNNLFSSDRLHLNVQTEEVEVNGDLHFGALMRPQYDVMGPFQYVPFMECRHSVFSISHTVSGKLMLNGNTMDFEGGKGYIEGDRGHSFPRRYLWTQCGFNDGSLMLSVADIPFSGCCFTGVIGIVFFGGREYRIATYLGARIVSIGNGVAVVRQGKYVLTVQLLGGDCELLAAPVLGSMTRRIRESISCRAHYSFCVGKEMLFDIVSDHASFENEYN